MKPRVAVFSFTGCEGCSLAILECENELLDVLNLVDIVRWREAMTETTDDIDIALIDGSISTHHGVKRIKRILEMAKMVIPIGACAHNGGKAPQELAPFLPWSMEETRRAELSAPLPIASASNATLTRTSSAPVQAPEATTPHLDTS